MTRTRRTGLALTLAALVVVASPPAWADHHEEKAKAEDQGPSDEERRKSAEQLFARIDTNRNQVLAGDEIPNPGWLERYDRDGDDEITKKEMLTVVARGAGYDRLFLLRDPRARARNARNQFDQDKDGRVSAEEYPGDERTFAKFDRDNDDALEWKELLRLAEDELNDIRKRMKSPGRYEFLNLFDLDYDRQVTRKEYDGPARSFRKYDENGDGVVDYYEIYPDRRPDEAQARGPQPEDLNVISTLDANGDGRVGREEFKGSEAAWKRLDRNRDGWITVADAR